jgi:hypothetical protein
VITAKGDRELAGLCMATNHLSHGFRHFGHETGILQDTNRWVILGFEFFKLVVTIELYFPAQSGNLINEASFDQVDGALIDAGPWL